MPEDASLRGWRYASEAAAYQRSIETILEEQSISDRLLSRPEVTADAIRVAMQAPAAIDRALTLSDEILVATRQALDEKTKTRRKQARARAEAGLEPASLVALAYGLFFPVGLLGGDALWPAGWVLLILALVTGVLGSWLWRRPSAQRHIWSAVVRATSPFEQWLDKKAAERALEKLEAQFSTHSARQALLEVITALLGEDPHSVLMYDSAQGLRARKVDNFFVLSAAGKQLARKLSLLDGGTIALSGPRGSGRTTLLRAGPHLLRTGIHSDVASGPDLVVTVDVPAAYVPYDFVLSFFVGVCEQFLKRSGHAVPDFTRLSGLVRWRQHAAGLVRRSFRWLLFAVPAAALLILGAASAARGWWADHSSGVGSWAVDGMRETVDVMTAVWQGRYSIACLAIVYAGVVVWLLRPPGRLRRLLGLGPQSRIGRILVMILGLFLLLFPIVDGLLDLLLTPNFRQLDEPEAALLYLPLITLIVVFLWLSGRPRRLKIRDRLMLAVTVSVVSAGGVLTAFPLGRSYLADTENPARLAVFVLGIFLIGVGWPRRTSRPPQSPLARRCENQLYRLRTAQSTSAALNLVPTSLLTTAHSSSLSSVPPNFPQLVSEFRELLGAIADELHDTDGSRLFLCIDELDRMGDADKTREFLGEVKAVLGVRRVICMVTVAEDVSAAFVRRGLPHRDAADTAFDAVVHVQPLALAECTAILEQGIPSLSYPYVVLAHALSGGIPLDLIRCARRLVELRQNTPYVELRDISYVMLTEELSDTLAGFRTLLSGQPWTASTAHVLTAYRILIEQLNASCPHRRGALVQALYAFVWPAAPAPAPATLPSLSSGNEGDLPDNTRLLIAEARAYAIYGLTLIQIFSPSGFEQRSIEVAARGPDGATQRLADMRLEFSVSPYSARELIDRVRMIWGLPDTPANLPPAESGACNHPPCASDLAPMIDPATEFTARTDDASRRG
ncbi:hypothetical protein ABT090_24765 [Streptomyces asoensis]|uniref:hypothetical protein n=1 Tax=Streptomyces asoensis TaxID=249586 RepID=UPI0033196833